MALLTGPLPLVPPASAAFASQQDKGPSVVALGGGHGLSASLSALRLLTSELTAVVTVADDGGSSGRLREEYGVLPPGDLRMALSALCDDTDWGRTWRDVMQHRFAPGKGRGGSLDEHAMGNLLIVTLWELLGDTVAGLKWAGALLGARGEVLPMSSVPLTIEGQVRVSAPDGSSVLQTLTGQAKCAVAGSLERVRLLPEDAPACIEALTAIELADWVILGPGSWYTSVLPHLLLPEMREALCNTAARRCPHHEPRHGHQRNPRNVRRRPSEGPPGVRAGLHDRRRPGRSGVRNRPRRLRTGGRDARRRGGVG